MSVLKIEKNNTYRSPEEQRVIESSKSLSKFFTGRFIASIAGIDVSAYRNVIRGSGSEKNILAINKAFDIIESWNPYRTAVVQYALRKSTNALEFYQALKQSPAMTHEVICKTFNVSEDDIKAIFGMNPRVSQKMQERYDFLTGKEI